MESGEVKGEGVY